jgi:hypothetical protein
MRPSNEPDEKSRDLHGVDRRKVSVALLAVLAGGLGAGTPAQALTRRDEARFNAASNLLAPYGVSVDGETRRGYDVLSFGIVALPAVQYTQDVATANRLGGTDVRWKTSFFDGDASATHFHPGEIIPCIRTTIEDDALATHEVFDADQGGIIPCVKVASEMLEGGHIGDVVMTHFHDGAIVPCVKTTIEGHARAIHELFDADDGDIVPCVRVASEMLKGGLLGAVEMTIDDDLSSFRLTIEGGKTYRLVGGELVVEGAPPT